MSGPDDSPQPIQINGVAHVILRVNRVAECIAFYDRLMPFLGLSAIPPRSDDFVYYVGGRTALAIRRAEPEHAGVPHIEAAAGLDHLCFRARSARTSTRSTPSWSSSEPASSARLRRGRGPRYYSLSFLDPRGSGSSSTMSRARTARRGGESGPIPSTRSPATRPRRTQASSRMVTGPSFTSSTSIRAPNAPRFAARRSQKRSYSGSASSPGAASA